MAESSTRAGLALSLRTGPAESSRPAFSWSRSLRFDNCGGDRVGFTPRPKSVLPPLFKLGWVKPDAFRLILSHGEPVGYLQMQKGRGWVKSDEVVLTESADPGEVMAQLQREAAPGWLVLQGTFVRDSSDMLGRLGYLFTDYPYYGLMVRPLKGVHKDLKRELGTVNRSFTCHFLDYF